MADFAHTETDKRIEELEKRLQTEYRQAYRETRGKLEKYLSDFARKDEAKRKLVDEGKLSQEKYKEWRTNQMLTGQRWTKMVDTLAKDMNRTNQIAADIISGQLSPTFALNANFAAYGVENGFQTDFGFTLYNEDTVNRLIEENPDLLPAPRIDIPEDIRWNKQKITSNITQAVLQGKAIPEIAKTMQTVVGMNKASATRNARTAMTGAQNAGRQQAYDRAKAMGIKVKKEWIATLDGRTRHSHGKADGQQVEIDGKFTVGRAKMRYPGDVQNGTPEELYNCRCTMVTVEPDYILKGGEKPKSFEEWQKEKQTNFESIKAPKNENVKALKASDFSYYDVEVKGLPENVVAEFNACLEEVYERFGNKLKIKSIEKMKSGYGKYMQAAYNPQAMRFSLKSSLEAMQKAAQKQYSIGFNATNDYKGLFYHEIGHAVWEDLSAEAKKEIYNIYSSARKKNYEQWLEKGGVNSGITQNELFAKTLSKYALQDEKEFFSEAFAQIMSGRARPISREVKEALLKYYKKG